MKASGSDEFGWLSLYGNGNELSSHSQTALGPSTKRSHMSTQT